ncbi:PucR family transcriptional regulator [Gordonia sp. TBRC 11910]|uniref:PucR family transcriptional regulator n=1 Tax=Gordonia asplenii TaxID=2725283 RepID=A0A848KWS2_9ACTN|nr:PucR family transcriptional regulator ligand-binding domain-containing protein [Gordonia asplenii]NMO03060.1 PucR family transcriptional regulator [Gordonia asplenii]
MSQLTLAEALTLPPFRRASPLVVASKSALGRPIRWAHATERSDVEELLRSGDLLLTMGTGLPDDDDTSALTAFAQSLADVDSAGLVVELGRRWRHELPPALVAACEAADIPLVVLRHETRFAELTQAIGEYVVDAQLSELRDAQRVHETFTELSFTQASPADILAAVERLADGPVVLENAQHRPLDYLAGGEDMAGFLDRWRTRSARVRIAGRTGWDPTNGWLVTRLGTADQVWGRLIIGTAQPPSQRLIAVAERAGAALALHRLHDRDRDNVIRRKHRETLAVLRENPHSHEARSRADLVGFPLDRRRFLGLLVRPQRPARAGERVVDVAASAVRAAHTAKVPALVCEVDQDIQILLSLSPSADAEVTADRIATRLHAAHDVVIASGRPVADRSDIAQTLQEAAQVADAVPADAAALVYRLDDLHLRGLLSLFGDDDRIRLFADRELAPLRANSTDTTDLMSALRALLLNPAGKTAAAASLHLSRAAFYDRLAKIERILGVDLDDPDIRVSLHVALVADDMLGAAE